MSEDQRQRAEKELRDGARDFERAKGELQDDFSARRNEEMSRLQRTILEEVRNYAKSQNFDLVLTSEVVLYNSSANDITAQVLAAMQSHSGAAAKPAGASGTAAPPAKPTK
jgi:outer membrane protein